MAVLLPEEEEEDEAARRWNESGRPAVSQGELVEGLGARPGVK